MKSSPFAALVLSAWLASCSSSETSNPRGTAGVSGLGSTGSAGASAGVSGSLPSSSGASGTATNAGASNAGAPSNGGAPSAGAGGNSGGAAGANSGLGGNTPGSGGAGAIITPPGYQLVWHDEFDTDGAPNPANWKFERGFVRNEEAQWYQANNASVKAGMLVIEARKETVPNPSYTGAGDWRTSRQTADYTSASLNTSGLQSFQYGHFEMRGRIPTAAGMWPAWWTLGVSGEWPSNGEIDIMEFYQAKVLANVACGTGTRYTAKWDSVTKSLTALGTAWASSFHVWTMDWDADNIVLSIDGQPLNTTALSSMLNPNGVSPFKQKAYVLLNVAVGGQNGGSPAQTTFPQRFEVDYVRVFQKP